MSSPGCEGCDVKPHFGDSTGIMDERTRGWQTMSKSVRIGGNWDMLPSVIVGGEEGPGKRFPGIGRGTRREPKIKNEETV